MGSRAEWQYGASGLCGMRLLLMQGNSPKLRVKRNAPSTTGNAGVFLVHLVGEIFVHLA